MRILMVSDIGTEVGGAEVVIVQLRDELILQGHEVRIITGDLNDQRQSFNDCSYRSFDKNSLISKLLYLYNPFSAYALKKVLKSYNPDVVHLHNIAQASSSILFLLRKYPTVMTVHDFECIDKTKFKQLKSLHKFEAAYRDFFVFGTSLNYFIQKFRYIVMRKGQKNIDAFIAPSKAIADILIEANLTQKPVIIYNGVQLNKKMYISRSKFNPYRLIFVGRLVREKGVEVLIRSLPKVLKKNRKIELKIIGDGPEIGNLKSLSEELELENVISFYGKKHPTEVANYYKNSDLVVIPSVWFEPLGIVALEAMAYSLPVVASSSGGLKEVVTKDTGITVEPGDIGQLSSAISKLLLSPALLRSMSKAAYDRSKLFTTSNNAIQTNNLYQNIIQRYK